MATSPLILNNPILTKAIQDRQLQQPQESPVGLGQQAAPAPLAASPAIPTAPQARALAPPMNAQPLAKVAPPAPSPAELGHQTEYNRLTGVAPSHPEQGLSGISQIGRNPEHPGGAGKAVGRTLLQIADAIGGGLFPSIAMGIPGTELHHRLLVNHERGALDQEQKNRSQTAAEGLEAAKAEHQINTENMAATARRGPLAVKEGEGLWDTQNNQWLVEPTAKDENKSTEISKEIGDQLGIVPTKDGRYLVPNTALGSLLKPKEAATKEGELPLGERVPRINAAMNARYQVLHPGKPLPEHYALPPNATQKDFDRTDKLIEGEEKAFGTKENQNQTAELRRQTMALAAQNRERKDETATRTASMKAYTPALDSAERFNVMAKNYEDAVKNHDQQAMLSLLANHLGMTMGLQKGSRLTRDIIHEAENSRPWLQGMQAKFDKDGYLSGVNLTPQQMRQMVDLGRERFSEDVTKGRSEAHYMGANDEGPDRVPSRATINHYTALANGDAKKAKELAAADGWSVK